MADTTTYQLGGTFTFPGTSLTVHRMGYGAMQLAGPHVFGPPKDRAAAIQVLRAAVEAGVNHIDTSDFYGPHVTNQVIREALHPYPSDLVIVSKLGARRDEQGAWLPAQSRAELISATEDNLRNLGIDAIDIVNMRFMGDMFKPTDSDITEQMDTLAELQRQGKIRHIGLSHATPGHLEQALRVAPVVCVQNLYNLANRSDEAFLDTLTAQHIAYVPYFPLGGFTPLQSEHLDQVAASLDATPMQVALAWLLQRSPTMLLIPGTSSITHLHENLAAASLVLPPEALVTLDHIGAEAPAAAAPQH
ncbi:oxidoreductase [Acidipila sp. EB88]|uniref:oxidoreductase n=1 Tax=Acidipila sp. EB88 TaxID=2305226 RepID=UPI000F5E1B0F|nr:oxidoreductase [Acidipila sp. EB88]RRA48490.1 oxidoreductase [Acidipila sp. EB88]